MVYILPLANHLATLENVGGKGMSLSKLIFAGIPVPDGFHVTTEAYKHFVSENKIAPQITNILHGADPSNTTSLEAASEQIRAAFAVGIVPQELKRDIIAAYQIFGDIPVAVRSSATAEDLPGASFAGQQDTYLNIHGEQEVLSAIKSCWASLWTARAISYRLLQDIDQDRIALAVVVQKLVFSDAAGVLFTANPVNGKRNEMVINAAWGLGEAVVSSLVTPDTTVVDKPTGKILSLEIAEKQVMTVRTKQGTEEKPVAGGLRKKSALSKEQIKALAKLGQRIEDHYEMPMDVEWALEKGKFYIVQARPITVLPMEWNLPEKGVLYTKGSLAEHLTSPVSPLFATLGMEAINQTAEVLWSLMFGKSAKKLLPKLGAYTVINGYVYFSCNYKPLLIMAKSLTPGSLRRTMRGSVSRYEVAKQKFEAVVKVWESKDIPSLKSKELLDGVKIVFTAACTYFTDIQLSLPAASMSELLFTKLYGKKVERNGISEISNFLLGFDTVSLEAEKGLYEIAMWVRRDPALKAYVKGSTAKDIEKDYALPAPPSNVSQEVWSEWKDRVVQHISKFGRSCYEFDFAHPTPQEVFTPTLEFIKAFVMKEKESPISRQKEKIECREQAFSAVMKHTHGLRRRLFIKMLRWAQETAPMREDAIYHMGMGHPLIRRMLQELSHRLIEAGAIRKAKDIYWLRKMELEQLVWRQDSKLKIQDTSEITSGRKQMQEKYHKLSPPPMLPEKQAKTATGAVRKNGQLILNGIGTSTGIVTATACVLHGPADFENFQPGDVLVAVTTTPAWTPLFANASAVVTDIGGPLSHSSIVAREYSIPAVMAAHNATRYIRSGQTITVDGKAGTVVLHE